MARLSRAVPEYLNHLRARRLAPATIQGRQYALQGFQRAVGDLPCTRIEQRHVDTWFNAHPDWGNGTRNNALTHLKGFVDWCQWNGYMGPRSPLYGYGYVQYQPAPKQRIPVAEWPRLYAACSNPVETAVVTTGLYLFLRASEQRALRVGWLSFQAHEVKVWRKKVGRFQTLYMSAEFETRMREYVSFLAAHGWAEPDHYLLPKQEKPRARKGSVGFQSDPLHRDPTAPIPEPWDVVKTVLARAGYPTHWEGEHTLRRSGARAYFDTLASNGYDRALRRVMLMLGHKHSHITESYLGLDVETVELQRDLAGKPMFPELQDATIAPIREGLSWQ